MNRQQRINELLEFKKAKADLIRHIDQAIGQTETACMANSIALRSAYTYSAVRCIQYAQAVLVELERMGVKS